MPVEGVLNHGQNRATARCEQEARRLCPGGGAERGGRRLMPVEGVLNQRQRPSEARCERGGSAGLCLWRGC